MIFFNFVLLFTLLTNEPYASSADLATFPSSCETVLDNSQAVIPPRIRFKNEGSISTLFDPKESNIAVIPVETNPSFIAELYDLIQPLKDRRDFRKDFILKRQAFLDAFPQENSIELTQLRTAGHLFGIELANLITRADPEHMRYGLDGLFIRVERGNPHIRTSSFHVDGLLDSEFDLFLTIEIPDQENPSTRFRLGGQWKSSKGEIFSHDWNQESFFINTLETSYWYTGFQEKNFDAGKLVITAGQARRRRLGPGYEPVVHAAPDLSGLTGSNKFRFVILGSLRRTR